MSPPFSPFCEDLRSKRYYFLQGPPLETADILDHSNDCWCGRTLMRLGPDGDPPHPDDCRAGRGCYRTSNPALQTPEIQA